MKNPFKIMSIEVYQCPECKDWIYSRAQHDFIYCKCKEFAVDGGRYSYEKEKKNIWVAERFIKHMPKTKIVEIETTCKELYDDWNEHGDKYGRL